MKGLSDILNDIGNYYFKVNQLNKALNNFNSAVDISTKTNDKDFPYQMPVN